MKMYGGHLPRIAGRPPSAVTALSVPSTLLISLRRFGSLYRVAVRDGGFVRCGETLAEHSVPGGTVALPAPANGIVHPAGADQSRPEHLHLEVTDPVVHPLQDAKTAPQRLTAGDLRQRLARGGVWPYFWSSRTGGMPALTGEEIPRAVIVNGVVVEPFRTRGKVVLRHSWHRIIKGIEFLPRLMQDYATVEIVLADKRDPVAQAMYRELAGHAWVRFHPVPLVYPIENPRVLWKALRRSNRELQADDPVWVIDMQGMEALGAWMAEGIPPHSRIVAVGGPGHPHPKHLSARIGTPVTSLLWDCPARSQVQILRGGLLQGIPVDPESDAVGFDDDAFFLLPKASKREFLAFIRPGFDRTSMSPCFASRLTGARDSHISTSLRGERRPCIACGRCEEVCPARLMPQVLHRYLYREAIDETAAAGLDRCVACGLCSYVCPSKIDLQNQFSEAKQQLLSERGELQAAEQTG